jgi:hypothetical protein
MKRASNEAATKAPKLAQNTDARPHELSAEASLSAEDADKRAPAHVAAQNGDQREPVSGGWGENPTGALDSELRTATGAACDFRRSSAPAQACRRLGGMQTMAHRQTTQHYSGHEGCLRVPRELGAGASLALEGQCKLTPAHLAATHGREGCLRVPHEFGAGASLSAERPLITGFGCTEAFPCS